MAKQLPIIFCEQLTKLVGDQNADKKDIELL
jgi:hypothetical protein